MYPDVKCFDKLIFENINYLHCLNCLTVNTPIFYLIFVINISIHICFLAQFKVELKLNDGTFQITHDELMPAILTQTLNVIYKNNDDLTTMITCTNIFSLTPVLCFALPTLRPDEVQHHGLGQSESIMLNWSGISHQQCAGRTWSKIDRIMEKVYCATRLWCMLTYVRYIYICCCGSFVETKVWNAIRLEISCKITSIYLCINTNQINHVILEWKQAYGELLCTIILYIIICVAIIWKDNGPPMFIFHEPHMHICASQIPSSSFFSIATKFLRE